jgi:hypothetical protein
MLFRIKNLSQKWWFIFLVTVLMIPLPFCSLGVFKNGLRMDCLLFNPSRYFFNPFLKSFDGMELTIIGRLDLAFLTYVINAVLLLPILVVYLILRRFLLRKISIVRIWILWISIVAIYWLILFYVSQSYASVHPREMGIYQLNSKSDFSWKIE